MKNAILVLAALFACAACSESREQPEHESASKAASGAPAGAAAPLVPVIPTLPAIPTLTCAEDVENQTHCGGRECPALAGNAAIGCTIGCCTADDHCGMTTSAIVNGQRVPSVCIPVALPDERCPPTNFAGIAAPGCCDATGRCGQLWASQCVSLGQGMRCDEAAADGGK